MPPWPSVTTQHRPRDDHISMSFIVLISSVNNQLYTASSSLGMRMKSWQREQRLSGRVECWLMLLIGVIEIPVMWQSLRTGGTIPVFSSNNGNYNETRW